MPGRPFQPGHAKLGGSKKGSRKKLPKNIRDAISEALNRGEGAVAFFEKLKNGSAEDRRTFAMACARCMQIEANLHLNVEPTAESMKDIRAERLGKLLAFSLAAAAAQAKNEAPPRQPVAALPAPPVYKEVDRRKERQAQRVEDAPVATQEESRVYDDEPEYVNYAEQGFASRHFKVNTSRPR